MRIPVILLALCLLLLTGCDSTGQKAARDLRGTWQLTQSEWTFIFPDGRTEPIASLPNSGTLRVQEGGTTGLFNDFSLSYQTFEGRSNAFSGQLTVDDEELRVLLGVFDCGVVIFNCTLVMNIVDDEDDLQVWDYFYAVSESGNPFSAGAYDPTRPAAHIRWRLTLRR